MKLEIDGGAEIIDPSSGQIHEALEKMARGEADFVILSREDEGEYFIQAAGTSEQGLVLEYREGGEQSHYECSDPSLRIGQIIDAFNKYAQNDSNWTSDFPWTPLDFSGGKPKSGCLGLAVLIIAITAGLLFVY